MTWRIISALLVSSLFFSNAVYAIGETALQSSISKDGITWTFSQPVLVGKFVNDDYYVVGPVTIISISPAPTISFPYLNGSVWDLPTSKGHSGFDSRLNDGKDQSWCFDATLRSYPPITLGPGDSLVSSISLPAQKYHHLPEIMFAGKPNISPVGTVSILTDLSAPVSADAFRPSYCDRNQTIYYANDLNRSLLPSLAPPNPDRVPSLSKFENWYRRPWIDTNRFLFDVRAYYMPSYGQGVAFADSYVVLLLSLNFPASQKVKLTNYFVQYGIDLYGCLKAGVSWSVLGDPGSGRKLPIIFAGILLNNDSMKNVSSASSNSFGEDMQKPSRWPISWVGEALAVHLLGAENVWGHPAFFDYVDQWMTEPKGKSYSGPKWLWKGQTRYFLKGAFPENTFIDDMWATYRHVKKTQK